MFHANKFFHQNPTKCTQLGPTLYGKNFKKKFKLLIKYDHINMKYSINTNSINEFDSAKCSSDTW